MIKALRGMNDILDEQARIYSQILSVCERVARNYGFCLIETRRAHADA